MNGIFIIAGIAIISSGLIILLKQYKSEYAFAATVVSGIVILSYLIISSADIFEKIEKFFYYGNLNSGDFTILIRCLGICILTKTASEMCRDFGQGSIASKVDFAGKIFILIAAAPLFEKILEIIEMLINL